MANIKFDPKSIKLWIITLSVTIPMAIGAISKGIDMIKYDIFKKPHNDEEIFVKHMTMDHLIADEDRTEKTINTGDSKITTWLYRDKCIVVRRIDENGQVTAFKILPDPDKIDKIKKTYGKNYYGTLEAFAAVNFSLGYHARDTNFTEKFLKLNKGVRVIRTYTDGCQLEYKIDTYGNTCCWQWLVYNH